MRTIVVTRRSLLLSSSAAAAAVATFAAASSLGLAGCSGGSNDGGDGAPPVLSRETRQVGLWAGQSARFAAHLLRLTPDGPVPREGNLSPGVRYRVTNRNVGGYQVRYYAGENFADDIGAITVTVHPVLSGEWWAAQRIDDPAGATYLEAWLDLHAPADGVSAEGEVPSYLRLLGGFSAVYAPAAPAGAPAPAAAGPLVRASGSVVRGLRSPERFTDEFDLRFDAAGVGTGTFRSLYRDEPGGGVTGAGVGGGTGSIPGPQVPAPSATLSLSGFVREPDGTLRAAFSSTLGGFAGEVASAPDGSGRIAGTAPEAGRFAVAWDISGGGTLSFEGRPAPERLRRVYGDWWNVWTAPPLSATSDPASQLYDPWTPW